MSKVACETAAALPDQSCGRGGAGSASPRARALDADAPAEAESVLLRVPGGVGFAHLFGAALRRDGFTKGSSNPKAAAEAAAAATRKGAPRAADSRRSTASTSSKTAAVVIGVLPASKVVAKERRAVAARAWRRPAAGARVFASEAVGPEPVSPKVSCFGAVLSESSAAVAPPPPGGTQEEEEEGSSGCWASLQRTALRLGLCRDEPTTVDSNGRAEDHLCRASEPSSKATAPEPPQRQRAAAVMSPPRPVVAPGLGDVKRLASRRWPDETMARGTV